MASLGECVRKYKNTKYFIDETGRVFHYEFRDHTLEDRMNQLIEGAAQEIAVNGKPYHETVQEIRLIGALQLFADRRKNKYSWWSRISILPGVRSWIAGLIKAFIG
jgi:hypothetical protein